MRRRITKDGWPGSSKALKGQNNIAQGKALGLGSFPKTKSPERAK